MKGRPSGPETLRREVGTAGAVLMGLGSILGTGVFVSLGVAAGITGPAVVLAVVIGAVVATFNGLSSAQLAANHPVSGGTYEYGYRYLNSWLGFLAGWTFLLAKGASAATAALGFAGYAYGLLGLEGPLVPLALAVTAVLTLVVLAGMRRSNRINTLVVSVTLLSLAVFVVTGLSRFTAANAAHFTPFFAPAGGSEPLAALLHASALMFVAYTGYGRIATLGEEVRQPRRTIPRAVVAALAVVMVVYLLVALVGVGALGAQGLAHPDNLATPLEAAAGAFGLPWVGTVVAVGAVTAMAGVLLNLLLGLSRVLLAMARRGDMPPFLARVDRSGITPGPAVLTVGVLIAALASVGEVRLTWSFSALTVLVYYAITNLAALRLPRSALFFPRWVAWAGFVSCLALAVFIDRQVWAFGIMALLVGLLWYLAARFVSGSIRPPFGRR